MWPEHSTIVSSWILKCNASVVVVVVAKKCEYHRTCCDYLVAAASHEGILHETREKKLQHFYQLVVNMV